MIHRVGRLSAERGRKGAYQAAAGIATQGRTSIQAKRGCITFPLPKNNRLILSIKSSDQRAVDIGDTT
jgi:hypothetical protein